MPIETAIELPDVSRVAFEEVDALVMKCAFASQNALGRLCEERVYENDIAARLRAMGMVDVYTQVAVRACHGEFTKEYRLDLVVNGVVYQLKTAAAFSLRHDAQVYHYAMMLAIHYLKLLNLRPRSVQGLLRYNTVMPSDRQAPQWDIREWNPVSPACANLFAKFRDFIADWGTHLDSHLYQEALIHFSGDETLCRRRVPVTRGDIVLVSHKSSPTTLATTSPSPPSASQKPIAHT